MKQIIKSIVILLTLSITSLIAHSHHAHGHEAVDVNKSIAEKKATDMLSSFIQKKIIDKSWANIEADSTEIKVIYGKKEWLIVFKNDKVEKEKQKLYVFLTIKGRYIAANYTGT